MPKLAIRLGSLFVVSPLLSTKVILGNDLKKKSLVSQRNFLLNVKSKKIDAIKLKFIFKGRFELYGNRY